jgi:hypothetical protein
MRTLILTCLLLSAAVLGTVATASAQPPPLVGACTAVTQPCWNGDIACVGISYQVPQCVPLQTK